MSTVTTDELEDFDIALQHWDPVLGLEVHVELNTRTKMFSTAPIRFGSDPNTNIDPTCLGLPGALPAVNREGVAKAIKIGLALNCQIAEKCRFARKNYFYPDSPKNFQTSQYDEPICHDGYLDVELDDGEIFRVPIERAHMEDDAGKSVHVGGQDGRLEGADHSLIDFNRAGVPLVEIVTRPIEGAGTRAPEVARAYVSAIRDIVRAIGVSEGKMEQGNVRADVNVSLRRRPGDPLGTRSETKNVNSLRSIERTVHYEIERHAAILDGGGKILQETRHWHEEHQATVGGRVKEEADDYRYFPEPDLVPVAPSREWVEELRAELPELPAVRRRRLQAEWGFADLEMRDVINAGLLDQIDATVAAGSTPAAARKWWTGELARRANADGVEVSALAITPEQVAELEGLVAAGKITDRIARDVVDLVLAGEGGPAEVVASHGLEVVSDDGALKSAVEAVIGRNDGIVAKIRGGKTSAVGALIGQVMGAMKGKADARRVREIILEELGVEG